LNLQNTLQWCKTFLDLSFFRLNNSNFCRQQTRSSCFPGDKFHFQFEQVCELYRNCLPEHADFFLFFCHMHLQLLFGRLSRKGYEFWCLFVGSFRNLQAVYTRIYINAFFVWLWVCEMLRNLGNPQGKIICHAASGKGIY